MASKELFVWWLRLCNIFNIQQDKKIIYITAVNKSQIKEVLSAGLWLVFSLAPHENVSCQRMSLQCWCFHSLHGIHTRPHIGNCPTVRRESHLSQCIAPSFSPPSVFWVLFPSVPVLLAPLSLSTSLISPSVLQSISLSHKIWRSYLNNNALLPSCLLWLIASQWFCAAGKVLPHSPTHTLMLSSYWVSQDPTGYSRW